MLVTQGSLACETLLSNKSSGIGSSPRSCRQGRSVKRLQRVVAPRSVSGRVGVANSFSVGSGAEGMPKLFAYVLALGDFFFFCKLIQF